MGIKNAKVQMNTTNQMSFQKERKSANLVSFAGSVLVGSKVELGINVGKHSKEGTGTWLAGTSQGRCRPMAETLREKGVKNSSKTTQCRGCPVLHLEWKNTSSYPRL